MSLFDLKSCNRNEVIFQYSTKQLPVRRWGSTGATGNGGIRWWPWPWPWWPRIWTVEI